MSDKYDYIEEDKDEEIVLTIRTHYFYLLKPFLKVVGLAIVIIIDLKLFGLSKFSQIIITAAGLIALYIIAKNYYIWENDICILTNKRMIDVNQRSFLNRSVSEASLDKILSSSYEIKTLAQNLFNFGNVYLKIAGFKEGLVLEDVVDPYNLQQIIIATQRKKIAADLPHKKNDKQKTIIR